MTLEKIHGKTALRMMQNAHITLDGVRVPEARRLHNVNSFRDVAAMLRAMRSDVAWIATGIAGRSFEAALRYVTERRQFGRPLASFQLVQEKLARMLGNVTSSLSLVVRLTEQQDKGIYRDQDSALAKMQTSLLMRETVALAREVVGGNGITLDDRRRTVPCRCRSRLLLRGHPRDQRPHRRPRPHRRQRLHPLTLFTR